MSKSFFIATRCNNSVVDIVGDNVIVDLPLDLYVDDNGNVYTGGYTNNAMLIYTVDNKFYARKVV